MDLEALRKAARKGIDTRKRNDPLSDFGCRHCRMNGSDFFACKKCGSRGIRRDDFIKCAMCEGLGGHDTPTGARHPCGHCRGTGMRERSFVECPDCDDGGFLVDPLTGNRIKCRSCDGRGKLPAVKIKCDECKSRDRSCRACGGLGVMTISLRDYERMMKDALDGP